MKYFTFLLLLCNVCFKTAQSQTSNIVTTDGYSNELHKANAGRITFMDGYIPLEKFRETDFLKSFELTQKSNLNIRVFMDNSITNYLHQLAPDLSPETLIVSGNYQFIFYVDGQFIYKENLHHGAGLKKNTTTIFSVPLTSTNGEDYWSIYMWERFKLNGGEKVLTNGNHHLKIEMRPYIKLTDNSEVMTGNIIAAGELDLIIKPLKITAKEMAVQPITPGSGWQISHTAFNKKKIEALNKKIAENHFKSITSLVVINDGKLLLEEYFNGANRNTLHDTRSVGKSFTAALMGIAIKEGYIKNENQPISDFYNLKQFTNYAPEKDNVTLKDLLTMSSAFNGSDMHDDSPGNEDNMYPTDNWVKFALDLPIDSSKTNGKQWDYFTAGVVILGDVLNKSVPGGLEKYADEKLFKPLQVKKYQWQYTPQKVANTAGGLQLTATGYAKFGQLFQNKGSWNGRQILPAAWVKKTFTQYLPIPERPNEFYGFLFWNKTFEVNGKNHEAFYCAGNGGSKIFIFKTLPLTIVITAKAYNRPYAHPQVDAMMAEYILPALIK